jgi:uncharacterized protein with GYD domain
MFGRHSSAGAKKISAEQIEAARETIKRLGGRVKDIYGLLGEYDVVIMVELPRMTEAMQASNALKSLTGISFYTAAALPVQEFDKMFG